MGCGPSKAVEPQTALQGGDARPEKRSSSQPHLTAEDAARRVSINRVGNLDLEHLEQEYVARLSISTSAAETSDCNILLLGTSDVGKSTLRRQMTQHFGGCDDHVCCSTADPHYHTNARRQARSAPHSRRA